MRSRMKSLKRLGALYRTVEESCKEELHRSTAMELEAQQAMEMQQKRIDSARWEGRSALAEGDRMGWETAEIQCGAASARRRFMEGVRREREKLKEEAKERYLASRVKSEQMKSLLEGSARDIAVEEGRRTQGISDDRFLALRRWRAIQAERLLRR